MYYIGVTTARLDKLTCYCGQWISLFVKIVIINKQLNMQLNSLGLSLIPVKGRERVSGKVPNINQRFVNSCLANSPSLYIYTVKRTL